MSTPSRPGSEIAKATVEPIDFDSNTGESPDDNVDREDVRGFLADIRSQMKGRR